MDYKQEMFYRTPEQNMAKMPFYMAYPMQTVYMEEMEYARDLEKLKEMYPKEVRSIQEMVEDECDKMEYEGSLMFDEYPDRVMLNQVVKRIYDAAAGSQENVQKSDVGQYDMGQYEQEQYEEGAYRELDMEAEELPLEGNLMAQRGPGGGGWESEDFRRRDGRWDRRRDRRPERDDGMRNLIEVLLFNEMYQRRCRHKRCRRWW